MQSTSSKKNQLRKCNLYKKVINSKGLADLKLTLHHPCFGSAEKANMLVEHINASSSSVALAV